MAQLSNYPSSNRLLAALSSSDRELLEPHLDTVETPVKFECEHPDAPIEHASTSRRAGSSRPSMAEGTIRSKSA
jgi:hypothetical protein